MKTTRQQRTEAEAYIRRSVVYAVTIHGIVRYVAKSGMMRVCEFYVYDKTQNVLVNLSRSIAIVLGYTWNDKHEGIAFKGCGYNPIEQVVYDLCCKLNLNLNCQDLR